MRTIVRTTILLLLVATLSSASALGLLAPRETASAATAPPLSLPPASAWRSAASSGEPVELHVGGERLLLHLEEERGILSGSSAATGLAGEPVPLDHVLLLEGRLLGHEGSWVRVAVFGERVVGIVESPLLGRITLAPLTAGGYTAVDALSVQDALVAAGVPTEIEPESVAATTAQDCDSLSWTPVFASPVDLVLGTEYRSFDIAWAVDEAFVQRHADWSGLTLSFVHVIDGIFERDFGLDLTVVHLVAVPQSALPGRTTALLLDQLQDYYVANHRTLARDNVHLFTGVQLEGGAAGQVNCVGSAGRTGVSYSVGGTVWNGPYDFGTGLLVLLPDMPIKVGAHELAHTLSAHHHYANCAETMPTLDPLRTFDLCTVMINDWGLIQTRFSTASRLAVMGWADAYDI